MRLQDQDGKLREGELPNSWEAIRRIQLTLGIEHREIAGWLRMTSKDYLRFMSEKKDVPVTSMMALAEHLKIGFDLVVTNSLDYRALAQHFSGNKTHLPEQYAVNALSKRRNVINVLDYIEMFSGWEKRMLLLRRFQMNEAMFRDPEAPINLRFSIDLLDHLFSKDTYSEDLVNMGKFSVFNNRNSKMGIQLSMATTMPELFEIMFNDILSQHVEKNFRWKLLSLDFEHCLIEGCPTEELRSTLSLNYVNNRSACLVRQGFLASMPMYLDQPMLQVKECSCVAFGDPTCRFEVRFDKKLSSTQRKPH